MTTNNVDKLILQIHAQVRGIQQLDLMSKKLNSIGIIIDKQNKLRTKSGLFISSKTAAMELYRMNMVQEMAEKAKRVAAQQAKEAENAQRKMQGNMLSFGLSALFTGMAIKRLGDQILNSLVKTYMQATDEQSKFNQQLMGVQASFEFLKFSIIDALGNSDFVIGFIEMLININNIVGEFISKHSKVAALIGLFTGTAIVGGGILMVIGQATLGVLGLIAAYDLLKIKTGILVASPLINWLKATTLWTWLAAAPWALIVGVISILIGTIMLLAENTGGVGNAFKALGIFVLAILAWIGDTIITNLLSPINAVIDAINLLIKGWNALANTSIGENLGLTSIEEVKRIEAPKMSDKVWEWRNQLIAEGEAQKQSNLNNNNTTIVQNVYGDVTESNLMAKIKEGIEATLGEQNNRYNGTTTGG